MVNQKQFYQSKKWINLMNEIKLERLNENGMNVCEECGKEIDGLVIGHHKIELNDFNCNDPSISLNKNLIQLLDINCHNKKHSRFGRTTEKEIILVYGPPCSGKNFYINQVANRNDLIVDIDAIWQCLNPTNKRYDKPDVLKGIMFNIRDLLYDTVRHRKGGWEKCYIITGAPHEIDRNRINQMVGGIDSYIFIDTSFTQCIQNLKKDKEKNKFQYEWEQYIKDWFDRYIENTKEQVVINFFNGGEREE